MIKQPTFISIINSKKSSNTLLANNLISNNLHILLFVLVVILVLIVINYKEIYNNEKKLNLYITENFKNNNLDDLDIIHVGMNDINNINVDSLEELREQINNGSLNCNKELLKQLIMAPNLMQLRSGADMFNIEEAKKKIKDDANMLTNMVNVKDVGGPPPPPKVPQCTIL